MLDINMIELIKHKSTGWEFTDTDIEIAVDEINQCIINYCNIGEVPQALKYTVANMAVDLLTYEYEKNNSTSTPSSDYTEASFNVTDSADISSVSVGDTSVTLGNRNISYTPKYIALKSHQSQLDLLIMNYASQLNRFRVIY